MVRPSALLLLLSTWLASPAASGLEIALREELSTDRLYYTLGEIARLDSSDSELLGRLRALRIGRSPRVGYTSDVTRSAISARIERAFPGLHRSTRWSGPSRIVVRSVGREFELDRWEALARAHLAAWLHARSPAFELWPLDSKASVKLPAGEVEVAPRLQAGAPLRKRMGVWLDFRVDGQHYTTAPLWFGVSVTSEVLVAARDLALGTVLSPDDVVLRVAEVAGAPGTPVESLQVIRGQRVSHPLAAGEILVLEAIEPAPAIARGERLVVTARAGPVRIEAMALALEDGREGESIRVRNPDGRARYEVVVTGRRRATAGGTSR